MANVQEGPNATLFPPVQCPQPSEQQYLQLAKQWRALIDARGREADYAAERLMQVEWVLGQTGYNLDDTTVTIAIGTLRTLGKSARTCGKYLSSIKSFTRWLARPSARVLQFDPLLDLKAPSPKKDRRHLRTSFLPVLDQLLTATARSTYCFQGISGRDRAELYHAAACTGLREGTLTVVEVGQFEFGVAPARVRVRADQVKDGEDLTVPMQPDSAARVKAYLSGKMPQMRAFRTPTKANYFVRMLRKDLAEAGITYCRIVTLPNGKQRREQVLDFHALRGTFNTWCAEAGVDLGIRQGWMGHSDSELTRVTYGYCTTAAEAAAVLRLPPLPGVNKAS